MVVLDFSLSDVLAFVAGVGSLAAGLIGYSRKKGVKLLPAELEGRAEIIGGISDDIVETLGNISPDELAGIIRRAEELAVGGYSQADAMELGLLILKALQSNETKK